MKSRIGKLGKIILSPKIRTVKSESSKEYVKVVDAFNRYKVGDWGDLEEEDKVLNNRAVQDPGSDRILAKYCLPALGDIYIITEHDRSHTTILFCSEY